MRVFVAIVLSIALLGYRLTIKTDDKDRNEFIFSTLFVMLYYASLIAGLILLAIL